MTDMFVKTDLTGTKAEGWVKDGGTWHKIGGGGLPGLGGWADVTATTGSPTKHTYTDADGDWVAYEFTADGSCTTTAGGLVEYLIAAGGCGSWNGLAGSGNSVIGGSRVITGVSFIDANNAVTVGQGAPSSTGGTVVPTNWKGGISSIGPLSVADQWVSAGAGPDSLGLTSSILGSADVFGLSWITTRATVPNRGEARANTGGNSGVVIIRVPAAHAKA